MEEIETRRARRPRTAEDDGIDPNKKYLVRVHKTGVPEEEYSIPIMVNTCGQSTGGKREFYHNQEVELTYAQLDRLRNAVRDSRVEFPRSSGIYERATVQEQMDAARKEMPGYDIERNPSTGAITAVMHKRRFHIEYLKEDPFINKAA